MKRIAIFASGAGSNALNLLEHAKLYSQISLSHVIIDTETSPLPEILREKHPEVHSVRILPNPALKGKERKRDHETRIINVLREAGIEWILLAGYMRILGPDLLTAFHQKIINIHPSLLPLYPGVDSYRRAYEDGVSESGVTIHIVDEGVDTGPIILQEKFARTQADTLADFIQKGKDLEWKMYPQVLKMINESASLLPGV